jgi:LPXTG-motif cell wall-anchored protein
MTNPYNDLVCKWEQEIPTEETQDLKPTPAQPPSDDSGNDSNLLLIGFLVLIGIAAVLLLRSRRN